MPRNQRIGQSHRRTWKPGPSGPPKNSVTMTADMVMTFMNSARKNRAKRSEEYSVWKPPDQLLLALGQVEGRPVQLGRDRDQEDDEGDEPRRKTFQCQELDAWAATIARVDSEWRSQDHGDDRQPHGRLVGDHLGRGADRPEQRVLRSRRPAGQHRPVDGDRRHGQQEEDAHRRVGDLELDGVVGDGDDAADRDDGEDEQGRQERQVGRQLEDDPVGPARA